MVAVKNNGIEGAEDPDSVASVIFLAENEEIERPSDHPLAIVVDQLVKEIDALKKSYKEVSKRVDCLTPTSVNGEDTIIKSEIDRLQNQLALIVEQNKMLMKRNSDLENENASLLTTIKLLQGPSSPSSNPAANRSTTDMTESTSGSNKEDGGY